MNADAHLEAVPSRGGLQPTRRLFHPPPGGVHETPEMLYVAAAGVGDEDPPPWGGEPRQEGRERLRIALLVEHVRGKDEIESSGVGGRIPPVEHHRRRGLD